MDFTPRRRLGLLLGGLILALLIAAISLSVNQLATASLSVWIILWVTLPLICVPLSLLIIYRLYGLLTARYRLDRDGFYLTWGLIAEQIPLEDILALRSLQELGKNLRPDRGLWWPGYIVGVRPLEGGGTLEFFGSAGPSGTVVVDTGKRLFAISPPDLEAFQQAFVDATHMGSLEPIESLSQRPTFILADFWADTLAKILVGMGLVLPLFLLGYLAFRLPSLPGQVPFGFNPSGRPDLLAPPGRLLLLPMIAGLCWLADLGVGVWLYRRTDDRPLAYAVWGMAVVVGGLFWGAALGLLAAT
jgi:hypothetical protein